MLSICDDYADYEGDLTGLRSVVTLRCVKNLPQSQCTTSLCSCSSSQREMPDFHLPHLCHPLRHLLVHVSAAGLGALRPWTLPHFLYASVGFSRLLVCNGELHWLPGCASRGHVRELRSDHGIGVANWKEPKKVESKKVGQDVEQARTTTPQGLVVIVSPVKLSLSEDIVMKWG